ncbi:MAG: cyclodeaminase/cyclohydrolase family protein [Candidatus Omnitrophota bacterium]
MYINSALNEYLNDLAARKPAPGGGSAAALEAAMGCALMSMVANFTISNKNYEQFKERAESSLKRSEEFRKRFTEHIDEDVLAYTKLSEGFKKYDRDSPELGRLFKASCAVPYELCQMISDALTLCKGLVEFGNKRLVTDTAIAALMLESAFFGAKFNVYINLKYIKDKEYASTIRKTFSELDKKIPRLKEEVLHASQDIILK